MSSPNDNVQMRDGLDAIYKLRTKDVSAPQDGSLQVVRHFSTPYPVDYGVGGCYECVASSGSMAAGLAAAAPIWSFRFASSSLLAIIRRVQLTMWVAGTGFTAGIGTFNLFRASAWSVADTGGAQVDLTGDHGKLRTAMASSSAEIRAATTGALTAGTRTLDANPCDGYTVGISTATDAVFISRADLVKNESHPHVIAQNEGLVLQATVPATGVWGFRVLTEWDEVPLVNY